MADNQQVFVPDVGDEAVEVIEIVAAVDDSLAAEDAIVTVESDKASMDIPAPFDGVLQELKVAVGDKINTGDLLALMSAAGAAQTNAEQTSADETSVAPAEAAAKPASADPAESGSRSAGDSDDAGSASEQDILVPDVGDDAVEVIEIIANVGDQVELESPLVTVESDKASMDIPAPAAGKLLALNVAIGDKINTGDLLGRMVAAGGVETPAPAQQPTTDTPAAETTSAAAETTSPAAEPISAAAEPSVSASNPPADKRHPVPHHPSAGTIAPTGKVHASPSVRRLAREFGVDLSQVTGSGPKARILKEDVQSFVKYELSRPKATASTAVAGAGGLQVLAPPKVDFSKFGDIEEVPLTRIQKLSGPNLHRNWVTIPHVTQFDEADITDMEAFRKQQNEIAKKQKSDIKITPLVFLMKASADALKAMPIFNTSLSETGESLIQKKFIHIGIAVDTPNGLVVPVVRDVDKKGIMELSKELTDISIKARDGKLKAADMQGSSFTISSLGGIGGTAFTPIVNAPDVAILGVSKSDMKPKWNGTDFEPRLMLPLSLSYDHRVIDGAVAARFTVHLKNVLEDLRRILL